MTKLVLNTLLLLLASLLPVAGTQAADNFTLKSASLKAKAPIPARYYWNEFGCTGDNVKPALEWSGAPAGTKSYAITFYDHDAPTGSGFWHWVVYNIPKEISEMAENGTLPASAVEGNTDLGKPGFFGPCPPVGRKHRYTYTVYALDVDKLPVEAGATAAIVGFTLWQHTRGKASFDVTAGPRR